jgi:hypothetical protein
MLSADTCSRLGASSAVLHFTSYVPLLQLGLLQADSLCTEVATKGTEDVMQQFCAAVSLVALLST